MKDNLSLQLIPRWILAFFCLLTTCSSTTQYPFSSVSPVTTSPANFTVRFTFSGLTNGSLPAFVDVRFTRSLSPLGVDRVYTLLSQGYYNANGVVRIERREIDNRPFVVQFGLAADPGLAAQWWQNFIADEPRQLSNRRGTVALAGNWLTANSRAAMLFFNMDDNVFLDDLNYTPLGTVISPWGLATLQALDSRWMESIYIPAAADGGLTYLQSFYPGLPYVISAEITDEERGTAPVHADHQARHHDSLSQHSERSPFLPLARASQNFTYTVSWVGNTYGGGPSQSNARNASWVSYSADDMYVDPQTGFTVTNTPWDEGTRESGLYNAAGNLVGLNNDLHGWSRLGGLAVTQNPVNGSYYVGMQQAPISYWGPLRDYPAYDTWYCVRRYDKNGVPLPFPGGRGWDGSLLIVSINTTALTGV